MAGTNLEYGSVLLKNVHTLLFQQTPIRDPSGTDIWYWEFRIRVSSLIHDQIFSESETTIGAVFKGNSSSGSTNVGQRHETIRESLQGDRQKLIYSIDGVQVVRSEAENDCNNGPKVVDLKISHVSPKTQRTHQALNLREVWYDPHQAEHMAQNLRRAGLSTNNRWSSTDALDNSFNQGHLFLGRFLSRGATGAKSIRNDQPRQRRERKAKDALAREVKDAKRNQGANEQCLVKAANTGGDYEIVELLLPHPRNVLGASTYSIDCLQNPMAGWTRRPEGRRDQEHRQAIRWRPRSRRRRTRCDWPDCGQVVLRVPCTARSRSRASARR